MLNFVRARDVDYVPITLDDPDLYKTLPQGSWVVPTGVNNGEITYAIPSTLDPAANKDMLRGARISFSEKNRNDSAAVGKVTALRGVLVLDTDQFIAADGPSMGTGKELTLKKDTDGFIKLGIAGASDQVVAVVDIAPSDHPETMLQFHATLY